MDFLRFVAIILTLICWAVGITSITAARSTKYIDVKILSIATSFVAAYFSIYYLLQGLGLLVPGAVSASLIRPGIMVLMTIILLHHITRVMRLRGQK